MSLMTKQQRERHPRAQIQTLVRIAKRALARADWLTELYFGGEVNHLAETMTPAELGEITVEIRLLQKKAHTAALEILEITESSSELDLRREARVIRSTLGLPPRRATS